MLYLLIPSSSQTTSKIPLNRHDALNMQNLCTWCTTVAIIQFGLHPCECHSLNWVNLFNCKSGLLLKMLFDRLVGGGRGGCCSCLHALDWSDHIWTGQITFSQAKPSSYIQYYVVAQYKSRIIEKCHSQILILINSYHEVYWHTDGHVYIRNDCFPVCLSIIVGVVSHYWFLSVLKYSWITTQTQGGSICVFMGFEGTVISNNECF